MKMLIKKSMLLVIFILIKDACNISVCLGNHDIWLYNKIISHIEGNASPHLMLGGWRIESEIIETFNSFRKEYSDIELLDLAMMINEFNRQIEIHMPNGKKYLTAQFDYIDKSLKISKGAS